MAQSHPKYKYSYGVKDSHTHDEKHASEWRDGGNVGKSAKYLIIFMTI